MKRFWKAPTIFLMPLLVLGIQFGTVTAAHAAGDADLRIHNNSQFSTTAFESRVCNDGTDEVTKFVVNNSVTNFAITEGFVSIATSKITNGSTFGTFDFNTLTWTGSLLSGDCIAILYRGDSTVGANVSIDSNIVSSELTGAVVNVDPNNSNDAASNISYVKAANSDLDTETRLLTQGNITPTTSVEYEVTIKSIGAGAYVDNGFFVLAFVMPDGATFDSVSDLDTNDFLSSLGCQVLGPIANIGFPSLSQYVSGDVVACSLQASADLPSGTDYKFKFTMTAGTLFSNGDAQVIAIIEGNDPDTFTLFKSLAEQTDPLLLNTGNMKFLSYDPSVLAATASLCPGQSEVSTDGTGCFRISFNKDIVEETFGLDDIVVTGSGTASSLTKIGSNLWELRITGIAQNSSSSISLQTSGILDLSAIESSTSVLGINTIRYEVQGEAAASGSESTSAGGTLAETGINGSDLATPIMLLLVGFALAFSSRRKQIVSRVTYSLYTISRWLEKYAIVATNPANARRP